VAPELELWEGLLRLGLAAVLAGAGRPAWAAVVAAAALCVGGAGVTNRAVRGELPLVGGSTSSAQAGAERRGDDGGARGGTTAGGQAFDSAGNPIPGAAGRPGGVLTARPPTLRP